jgi:hypothetical protein
MLPIRLCLVACTITTVESWSTYRSAIPNGNSVVYNGQPASGVGHNSLGGGGSLNPFGRDFSAAGSRWTVSLCQKDSDGDGVANGIELGDPNCVWSPGQMPSVTTGITHPGFRDARQVVAPVTTIATTAAPVYTPATAAPVFTPATAAPVVLSQLVTTTAKSITTTQKMIVETNSPATATADPRAGMNFRATTTTSIVKKVGTTSGSTSGFKCVATVTTLFALITRFV